MTRVPKDPKERFQYYFDISTGLDDKYQTKINNIKAEKFSYKPENSSEYMEFEKATGEEADFQKKSTMGNYAELSQGYDNSMQRVAEKQINKEAERLKEEKRDYLYDREFAAWKASKQKRIENMMSAYAQAYGNAVYNMQKANEELSKV